MWEARHSEFFRKKCIKQENMVVITTLSKHSPKQGFTFNLSDVLAAADRTDGKALTEMELLQKGAGKNF